MQIHGEVSALADSEYLRISNQRKCQEILRRNNLGDEDIIDFLLSLHMVLEVSLALFFRRMVLMQAGRFLSKKHIIGHLDAVGFIDKATMFIYCSKFNFDTDEKRVMAKQYQSLIDRMKAFSESRNKLIHGHSVSTFYSTLSHKSDSKMRKKITQEHMIRQIEDFRFILAGLRFYLGCFDPDFQGDFRNQFAKEYLNDSFLL